MKINDPVTFTTYTDSKCGWVSKVSASGKTVEVEFGEQQLLNGPNSGEPDALTVHPGGYCCHVEGVQRWAVNRTANPTRHKFSLRKNGAWKIAGHSTNSPGCSLSTGHHPYYDFNF
jgi:hypothetical protein